MLLNALRLLVVHKIFVLYKSASALGRCHLPVGGIHVVQLGDCSSAGLFGFVGLFSIIGRKDYPRETILAGFGNRFTGGVSAMYCTAGRVDIGLCTFVGRVIILPALVSRPSGSKLSAQTQE